MDHLIPIPVLHVLFKGIEQIFPASDSPLQFQNFNQPCFTHPPEKFQYNHTTFSGSAAPKTDGDNNPSRLWTCFVNAQNFLQRRLQMSI